MISAKSKIYFASGKSKILPGAAISNAQLNFDLVNPSSDPHSYHAKLIFLKNK